MELTYGERLILIMLSEIYEHMGIESEIDPKFVRSAIYSNQQWGLTWKYSLDGRSEAPPVVGEVVDFLEMWDRIEEAHEHFSAEEKERVKGEAHPYGDARFAGFDGKGETEHISVTRFLIENL